MLPKVPSKLASQDTIDLYVSELVDYFSTRRNRAMREFFRGDVRAKAKLYNTLAKKREDGSVEQQHFIRLSNAFSLALKNVGEEAPPKPRKATPKSTVIYPSFVSSHVMRLHFLAGVSILRDRALSLAQYCSFSFIQTATNGAKLVSLGMKDSERWLFERLVETLGENGLGLSTYAKGGFEFHRNPNDQFGLQDVTHRMHSDNWDARRYSEFSARTARLDPNYKVVIPEGKPRLPEDLPWDPDPIFQNILNLTQTGNLEEALTALNSIEPCKREILFDEVLYLKFCLRKPIHGQDIRYIARKYVRKSSIKTQLEDHFEDFLTFVDANVQSRVIDPSSFPWNGLKDWEEFRAQAYREFNAYGYAPYPRGRIFVWHPNFYSSSVDNYFKADFVDAENSFRLSRGLPEIGKGWVSEAALYELIKGQFADAIFQWSPSWLGRQSIDVYVPSINLAFEYQGQQHYHPVELFGGEEELIATQTRDQMKRNRLKKNGVHLIEWHYSVPVNIENLNGYLQGHDPSSIQAIGM